MSVCEANSEGHTRWVVWEKNEFTPRVGVIAECLLLPESAKCRVIGLIGWLIEGARGGG